MNSKQAETMRCVHEEYINNRICSQEEAKIIKEVCTQKYAIDSRGTPTTDHTAAGVMVSLECGGGTKWDCSMPIEVCEDVAEARKERLPCCICVKVNTKIKKWQCGEHSHSGVITQDVVDFCHPALEYRSDQFRQAMDDDILPGAGYCENNFANGDNVLYQFYCDQATGSLQCGGGNRKHGRSFVLDNVAARTILSVWIMVVATMATTWCL